MARTVNAEDFALKRREILDAAQRLVLTRGYQQMSIQDILNELHISSGAFHHYFDSRSALLEALTEQMQGEVENMLARIVQDGQLSALEKVQRFFDTLDRLRFEQKSMIVELMHIWYADDNAVVRQKVDEKTIARRTPLMNAIVRQGLQEGVFSTAFPEQAGEIILNLIHGMSNAHARLLLSLMQKEQAFGNIDDMVGCIVTTHAAYMAAIELLLGAPSNALSRIDAEAVRAWVTALQADRHEGAF